MIGVDIGGSHITVSLIDVKQREIQTNSLHRQAVDANEPAVEILTAWGNAIQTCMKELHGEEVYIGIAMPGPFDYVNGISLIKEQTKFRSLYQTNVKLALAQRVGVNAANIQLINDAVSFLQGEVFGGAGQGFQRVLGLTLGTGLGSAWYDEGMAKDADFWSAPFKNGIAEDYFSTRWFLNRYFEKTGKKLAEVKELVDRYDTETEVADVFGEFGDNLGQFLNYVCAYNVPQLVVLGGNIARSFDYFQPSLVKTIKEKCPGMLVTPSTLQEDATLFGAASCWSEKFR